MEKKLLTERYYAGSFYGDMEYNAWIELLESAKRDIETLYPEVLTNGHPMLVEFDTETGNGDIDINIIYHRHESDYEYEVRCEKELKAKAANTMELRKKIDANLEETISYLKSIGAI
jgi:hypothetical protein